MEPEPHGAALFEWSRLRDFGLPEPDPPEKSGGSATLVAPAKNY